MNTQLSLLDYVPSEEEMRPPQPVAPVAIAPPQLATPPNPLVDYHQRRAALYLQFMIRIQQGRLSAYAKQHEITRLHQLRQQALAEIERLTR